jgi:hypothetical protein
LEQIPGVPNESAEALPELGYEEAGRARNRRVIRPKQDEQPDSRRAKEDEMGEQVSHRPQLSS